MYNLRVGEIETTDKRCSGVAFSVIYFLLRKRGKMMNSWKYAERTKLMNPIDDEFFRKMAEDAEFCQEILQVILEDKELTVEEVIPQNDI